MAANDTPDAYAPAEIARRVENAGLAKARLATMPLLALAVLAGAFIALGALFYTVVITGSTLGAGPTKLLGAVAFSTGLILVVVGGAELFTGNNLIVMAWVDRRITLVQLLRNWGWVYLGNLVGALGIVVLVDLAGTLDGEIAATARRIAEAKAGLDPVEAFARGVLCNVLVCLAIWLAFAARRIGGKILAVVFPIAAFVAAGFEHSIANMYLLPAGLRAGAEITAMEIVANLLPVTLGNIGGGGGILVALTYWLIYIHPARNREGE